MMMMTTMVPKGDYFPDGGRFGGHADGRMGDVAPHVDSVGLRFGRLTWQEVAAAAAAAAAVVQTVDESQRGRGDQMEGTRSGVQAEGGWGEG